MADNADDDVAKIRELIARQFGSISWTAEQSADWGGFAADFLPDALLVPAARPVAPTTVPDFVKRMKGVAANDLESLEETVLSAKVYVFGNVAVAMGVAGLSENGAEPNRAVEAMLLVKEEGHWRIAAQAWDVESSDRPVPAELLEPDAAKD